MFSIVELQIGTFGVIAKLANSTLFVPNAVDVNVTDKTGLFGSATPSTVGQSNLPRPTAGGHRQSNFKSSFVSVSSFATLKASDAASLTGMDSDDYNYYFRS